MAKIAGIEQGPVMNKASNSGGDSILSRLDVNTYFFSYDMIIDRPVQKVWPELANYHAWNPAHKGAKVERLAGEKSKEGEVILEYKKDGHGFAPPIIIETIKMLPNE